MTIDRHVHWITPEGWLPHGVRNLAVLPGASEDPKEVTCPVCREYVPDNQDDPDGTHADDQADTGTAPDPRATPGEGATPPDVNHSGESRIRDAALDRRRAWDGLMMDLESRLVTTRENARASARRVRAIQEDTGHQGRHTPEEWLDVAWAAQRLLDQLQGLERPLVLRDDTLGQLTLGED